MPASKTSRQLKEILFSTYSGFANKSQKNLDKYSKFIVDDRTDADIGGKGLNRSFCLIFADVVAPDRVNVMLTGGVPQGPTVTQWLKSSGAKHSKLLVGYNVVFDVTPANVDALLTLASAMAAITAPGASYTIPAYKYSAPRTAKSLRRLHGVLHKHWTSA